ncbi:hypothetical protein KBD61_00040 [Patescibacteria group bacterium]|nr:hypothetical protein [Patescibacteria group bacterium]MBP9709399.1 hypothetical protein [Patescibacteria group bacterium]
MEADAAICALFSISCREKEVTFDDATRLFGSEMVAACVAIGVLQETEPLKHDPKTGLEVYVDRGEAFVVPDDAPFSERQLIEPERLRCYAIHAGVLIAKLAKAMRLQGDPTENPVGRFWTLGSQKLGAAKVWCVVCLGELQSGDLHVMKTLADGGSHVMLFSTTGNPFGSAVPLENVHVRQIFDCFSIKQGKLVADPDGLFRTEIATLGRDVQFDKKSGAVVHEGKPLGRLDVGTAEYWMLYLLIDRYGEPVKYEEIIAFVKKKGYSRDLTPQAWCHKLKDAIGKRLGKPNVDKFLKPGSQKGCYIIG